MTVSRSDRGMRLAALATAAALFSTMASAASNTPSAGPARGAVVPPFEATDQYGDSRDFDSLAGENGLLLLFFRSADW